MIVITGAAGFIASNLVSSLNNLGIYDLTLVDDFSDIEKNKNLINKKYILKVDRLDFFDWINRNYSSVSFIFHLGARTDTTEFDSVIFDQLNLNYSKKVWEICRKFQIPLIYASSAATYGIGEFGYDDDHAVISKLRPLNPYGESKNNFDLWAINQVETPPFWAGFKFFNVFGPNEYHKGRMASVVFHAFNQISTTGKMKLFKSHNSEFEDGKQLRDFVYVKDLTQVLCFFMINKPKSGIYNLGTGIARTFLDLVLATFKSLDKEPLISFIDTPIDIRANYQYYTKANMDKLMSVGYDSSFNALETGVEDYVRNYLISNEYF